MFCGSSRTSRGRTQSGPAQSPCRREGGKPAAAHLARGDDWRAAGPPVAALVQIELRAARLDAEGITGEVIALDDPYGNLTTNISGEDFQKMGYAVGDTLRLRLGDRALEVPFVRTFSDVPAGKPLAFLDSRGRLSLAVNQGDFSKAYEVKPPYPLVIFRKK